MDATQIGTFYPLAPRRLVLEAPAHKYIDHMLIAVLLFMREKDDAASARADLTAEKTRSKSRSA